MLRKVMIAGLMASFGLTLVVWVCADDGVPTRKSWADKWNQFRQNVSGKNTADSDADAPKTAPPSTVTRRTAPPATTVTPSTIAPIPRTPIDNKPAPLAVEPEPSEPLPTLTTSRRRASATIEDAPATSADGAMNSPAQIATPPAAVEPATDPAANANGASTTRRSMNSLQDKIRAAQNGTTEDSAQALRPRVGVRPGYSTRNSNGTPPNSNNNAAATTSDGANSPTPTIAPESVVTPPNASPIVKTPAVPKIDTNDKPETIITTPGASNSSRRSVLRNRKDKEPENTPPAVTVELPAASDLPPATSSNKEPNTPAAAGVTTSDLPTNTQPPSFPAAPAAPTAPTSRTTPRVGPTPEPIETVTSPTPPTARRMSEPSPELALKIEGPAELPFGQTAVYKLVLANQGTAAADKVVIHLLPMDIKDAGASSPIGKLAPGESKSVEIELAARQTGTLTIRAQLTAANSARAEARQDVKVHQDQPLQVTVLGPETHSVGAPATYLIRISNHGTAAVSGVQVSAALPAAAKLLSATGDAQMSADESKVNWSPMNIAGGAELSLEIKCRLNATGEATIAAQVATAGRKIVGSMKTNVEGLANLKLEVVDPTGPLAVGEEAVYEVHIKNRGTKAAEKIYIDGLFSRGVEPVAAQGHTYEIKNGAVHFDELPALAPGKELVLTIRAVADRPGAHLFRAEAECQSLDGKYAQETTTRFQGEGASAALEARNPKAEWKPAATGEPTPAVKR